MATSVRPPQLILGSRMLYLVWLPADPGAVESLVPDGLTPAADRAVFMNQYVVDSGDQVSNFGSPDAFSAYGLTYLGADLDGLDANESTPGRWWTHYMDSSEPMMRYAAEHGVPVNEGNWATTLELDGDTLVATTLDDGRPIIRSTATVQVGTSIRANGQLRYITRVNGELVSGRYPFVADLAETFEMQSVEFLNADHPTYPLRPADPLTITFGFYSPSITFCYPGGEGPLGTAPHGG